MSYPLLRVYSDWCVFKADPSSVPNTICFHLPQGSLFAASNFLVNARSGEGSSSFRIALASRKVHVRWTATLQKPN